MNCIIIDDEPMARKGMKRLVETRRELELTAMFDSAFKATEWLKNNNTDLIFLDIEMSKLNGIEFARHISEKCLVVFTTAYSEYALDGFELDALDYLVKLSESVEDNNNSLGLEFIIVKADRKYLRIRLSDITYVEGLKDYVIIHLTDKKVVTRMTLKAMEDNLPKHRFIRVNKSFIVNKDKIDSFDNNDVCIGTTEIAIGLSYREMVLNALLN